MERVTKAVELYMQHQYHAAFEEIEAARQDGVESFDLYLYRGKLLQKMSRYGEAINSFKMAKEVDPTDNRPDSEIVLINNILSITNNFYYENPYTDLEVIDNL